MEIIGIDVIPGLNFHDFMDIYVIHGHLHTPDIPSIMAPPKEGI